MQAVQAATSSLPAAVIVVGMAVLFVVGCLRGETRAMTLVPVRADRRKRR